MNIRILAFSAFATLALSPAFAATDISLPATLPHSSWEQEIRDVDQMTGMIKFVWDDEAKRIFVVSMRLDDDHELAGNPDGYTWEELVQIFGFDWMEANDPSVYFEDALPKWQKWLYAHGLWRPYSWQNLWLRQPSKKNPEVLIHAPKPETGQRWQVEFVNTLNFLHENRTRK